MFEEELKKMIYFFSKKENIDYYKKTYGYKTTKQVLINSYGKANWGWCDNNGFEKVCTTKNFTIRNLETGQEKKYSWDYIAKEVDKIIGCADSQEQMSLF